VTASDKSIDRSFIFLAVAFLAYAAVYIFRLSFDIDGVRYFTLADDQMISMRYAENLASGAGLVWNAGGPRVEGFSSFLWVVYMALFHAAHVPRPWISACIQASGAILLLINLLFTKRLAERLSGGSAATGMIAAALTAFYVPLDNWAFQGTEVSVMTLTVTVIAYLVVRESWNSPSPGVWALVAGATLVRPSAIVIALALFLYVIATRPASWKQSLIRGGIIVGAFVIVETAFRTWYFGDPLPNTYYVKLTGIPAWMRIGRGFVVTAIFLVELTPVAWVFVRSVRSREWCRRHAYLLAIFGSQLAYNVYVGGDAWEWWGGSNRFVAIAMPLFFVMATTSVSAYLSEVFRPMQLAAATAACVFTVNVLAFAMWPIAAPWQRLLLIRKPPQSEQDSHAVKSALMLRRTTDPSTVIAVTWAGAIPYFSERPAIDLLGKMDPHIAHQPMHVPVGEQRWLQFVPDHLKWDYSYSISTLKPDIIQAPLWTVPGVSSNAVPLLKREYTKRRLGTDWYVRNDSRKVHFEQLGLN
jgi:arabinofuranosyltransferase